MCAALCGFVATVLLFVRLSRGYQPAESQRKNKRAEICPARLPLSSDLMGRIIAADLFPDLIAARFHRLIVAGAGGLNTLLVIQDANALWLANCWCCLSFFSTFSTLWQASILSDSLPPY